VKEGRDGGLWRIRRAAAGPQRTRGRAARTGTKTAGEEGGRDEKRTGGAACDGERPQRRRIHAGTSSNGERKTSCDGQLPLSRRAAREDDGADPTAVKILDRRRRATMAADPDEQGLLLHSRERIDDGGRQMAPRPAEMRRGRPDPGRADRGRGRRRIHDGRGLLLPCP